PPIAPEPLSGLHVWRGGNCSSGLAVHPPQGAPMTFLVKICGLRDVATLDAALAAGAGMVGFVHFARSPRHLALADAARLVARARAQAQAQGVVLAVDPDDATVARIVEGVKPAWLQLHGAETPERVAAIQAAHDVGLIKGIGVAGPEDVTRALTSDA